MYSILLNVGMSPIKRQRSKSTDFTCLYDILDLHHCMYVFVHVTIEPKSVNYTKFYFFISHNASDRSVSRQEFISNEQKAIRVAYTCHDIKKTSIVLV